MRAGLSEGGRRRRGRGRRIRRSRTSGRMPRRGRSSRGTPGGPGGRGEPEAAASRDELRRRRAVSPGRGAPESSADAADPPGSVLVMHRALEAAHRDRSCGRTRDRQPLLAVGQSSQPGTADRPGPGWATHVVGAESRHPCQGDRASLELAAILDRRRVAAMPRANAEAPKRSWAKEEASGPFRGIRTSPGGTRQA